MSEQKNLKKREGVKFQIVNGFILFGLFLLGVVIRVILKVIGMDGILFDMVILGLVLWAYNLIRKKRLSKI